VNFGVTNKNNHFLSKLQEGFSTRFEDMRKVKDEIQLLTCPSSSDAEKAPDNPLLKLIYLQSDNGLKDTFNFMKCADFLGVL